MSYDSMDKYKEKLVYRNNIGSIVSTLGLILREGDSKDAAKILESLHVLLDLSALGDKEKKAALLSELKSLAMMFLYVYFSSSSKKEEESSDLTKTEEPEQVEEPTVEKETFLEEGFNPEDGDLSLDDVEIESSLDEDFLKKIGYVE